MLQDQASPHKPPWPVDIHMPWPCPRPQTKQNKTKLPQSPQKPGNHVTHRRHQSFLSQTNPTFILLFLGERPAHAPHCRSCSPFFFALPQAVGGLEVSTFIPAWRRNPKAQPVAAGRGPLLQQPRGHRDSSCPTPAGSRALRLSPGFGRGQEKLTCAEALPELPRRSQLRRSRRISQQQVPPTHPSSGVLCRTFPSLGSWLKARRWEVGVGLGDLGEEA